VVYSAAAIRHLHDKMQQQKAATLFAVLSRRTTNAGFFFVSNPPWVQRGRELWGEANDQGHCPSHGGHNMAAARHLQGTYLLEKKNGSPLLKTADFYDW
jgi:hypothetical protein